MCLLSIFPPVSTVIRVKPIATASSRILRSRLDSQSQDCGGRALNFVGRLEVVQLDELRAPEKKAKEVVAAPPAFRELLPRRKFGTYKNQCGRIGVVAGSKGFIGAALMTSQGALRAGAGLVEVFVPEEIYEIVAGAAPMESMVKPLTSYRDLLKEKADVWAVGPGLGKSRAAEILELIEKAKQPMVIDADGLNILAEKSPRSNIARVTGCSRRIPAR
jgi:Predicted sugar kinase